MADELHATTTIEHVVSLEVAQTHAIDLVRGAGPDYYLRRCELNRDGSIADVLRIRFNPAQIEAAKAAIDKRAAEHAGYA